MEIIFNPKLITKENFSKFGDMISTSNIKPIEINNGYAKRFDGIANLNTSKDNGKTTICICDNGILIPIYITYISNFNPVSLV